MDRSPLISPAAGRPVHTVLGEIPHDRLGITDAHNHVWIDAVPGADPSGPVLDQYDKIQDEIKFYRAAGGQSLLDCQPGGCGRNANQLVQLSQASGVNIIACTGFHRRRYYPADHWLFKASCEQSAAYFLRELVSALEETEGQPQPVRAGFIKIALEGAWKDSPQALLEGVVEAAQRTGAIIEVHTEKGSLAEKAVVYFEDHGIAPKQLVLCHMDKRPDPCLHTELARYGVLLEYDTFYRPKYAPETNLWPLIRTMAGAGLSQHVALATDMAEAEMYTTIGNGPGLASLPTEIKSSLQSMGISENSIRQMLGGNIARRLAGLD